MNLALTHEKIDSKDWPPRVLAGDAGDGLAAMAPNSVDLVVCSPPYNIGKIYERDHRLSFVEYIEWQGRIVNKIASLVKPGGSVCWQVGNYIKDGALTPLDIPFLNIFIGNGFTLRNRIIWRFNFGQNLDRRFSGRYETVLWFTKGDDYKFNLDTVRVPQLYPGKRHSVKKGSLAGQPSGNPKGKNPSDYWEFSANRDFWEDPVWDIPNVKAGHPEKTTHPCQFPIEIAERCILALTDPGDLILDPFVGTGATLIAAAKNGRRGLGFEKDSNFVGMANRRIDAFFRGELPMRPSGRPVRRPQATEKVAQIPTEWTATSGRVDENRKEEDKKEG